MEKSMNVLSLFDGMSCGRIAFDKANISVDKYYASEIDKYAIKVTQCNYPTTIQLGDIKNWKSWSFEKFGGINFSEIDIIIGGSPCQGFSMAGKQLNFEDPRSKLFFDFIDIVNFVKRFNPNVKFMLENVKMKKEYQDIISRYIGVEPIEINSSLVSAQNRVRLYWTNIPNVSQPKDKHIHLASIVDNNLYENPGAIRGRRLHKATIIGRRIDKDGHRKDYDKSIPIVQCLEVRKTNTHKANCLTTVAKDNVLTSMPIGRHIDVYGRKLPYRNYTVKECCRLQTVPDNYFDGFSDNQAIKILGNGWTVDVIAHIFSFLPNEYKIKKEVQQ